MAVAESLLVLRTLNINELYPLLSVEAVYIWWKKQYKIQLQQAFIGPLLREYFACLALEGLEEQFQPLLKHK